jgi:hypothetical protein
MRMKVTVQKELTLSNKQIAELLKFPSKTVVRSHDEYDDGDRIQRGLTFVWLEEEEREM